MTNIAHLFDERDTALKVEVTHLVNDLAAAGLDAERAIQLTVTLGTIANFINSLDEAARNHVVTKLEQMVTRLAVSEILFGRAVAEIVTKHLTVQGFPAALEGELLRRQTEVIR